MPNNHVLYITKKDTGRIRYFLEHSLRGVLDPKRGSIEIRLRDLSRENDSLGNAFSDCNIAELLITERMDGRSMPQRELDLERFLNLRDGDIPVVRVPNSDISDHEIIAALEENVFVRLEIID